jgi:hypothetical protein
LTAPVTYRVYADSNPPLTVVSTNAVHLGADPASAHTYKVSAVSNSSEGPCSTVLTVIPADYLPSVPLNVKIDSVSVVAKLS